MAAEQGREDVYLELDAKRIVVASIDWPGWCRSGADEASALAAFVQAAPRYAGIVQPAGIRFDEPKGIDDLAVVERVPSKDVTRMGGPGVPLSADAEPMSAAETARAATILHACWDAFDRAVDFARGKELRKGPRGGGRELDGIVRHVLEAQAGYSQRIGIKLRWDKLAHLQDLKAALGDSRERVIEGLTAVGPIGVPPPGPRGGQRWSGRYFVRRVAYHVVDHTWEIEDRLQPDT